MEKETATQLVRNGRTDICIPRAPVVTKTSTSKVLRSCSSQVVNERFKKLDLAFNNVKPKDLYFVLD